jgi:hypothetical protein
MNKMILILVLLVGAAAAAQEGEGPSWKRTEPAAAPEPDLFRSGLALNLPTASTLRKGEMQFEVSHRFSDPVSSGHATYYGLDSHANTRLAFGYALSDRLTATVGRSNAYGNVDLRAHYRFWERGGALPLGAALQAGAGWNSNYEMPEGGGGFDGDQMQVYASAVLNGSAGRWVSFGLVPSYLANSDLSDPSDPDTFAVGGYVRVRLSRSLGLLAELNAPVSGYDRGHDAFAFGLELETGGHFFKLLATNAVFLNPSTYLAGSDYAVSLHELRFGFVITRLLGGRRTGAPRD